MEPLSLQQTAEFAGGTLLCENPAHPVANVVTDTRDIQPGELFVALVGENFDGHHFLAKAAERGACGAIVSAPDHVGAPAEHFAVIRVDDTLLAYQRLAAAYRRRLSTKVVGITGSNGKTSTKDFAAAVLGARFQVLKTEGNFNNHIGVPRMLLRLRHQDEVAVLEMGMNHPGEIKPLAEMALPEVGIITNIGTAHIEYMGSREAIAQEKGVLVESIREDGHVILPAADPFSPSLAARTRARVITAGMGQGDLRAENVRTTREGSHFEVTFAGERAATSIGVPGDHMIVNALLGVGAGIALGMSLEEAAAGLASATLTKGRLQWRPVGDLQVVDDSYNANPDSMVAALKTLAALPTSGCRIAVLGRMGELGSHAEEGHRRVGEAAASLGFDCVMTVGAEAGIIARSAASHGVAQVHALGSIEEAARRLHGMARPGDLILVKGSRSAGMERVISTLAGLKAAPGTADSTSAH